MDLLALADRAERYGIGLMSGSSCDGVDAALVRIKGTGAEILVKLLAFETSAYPEAFRMRLLAAHHSVHEACTLNFQLGEYLADAAAAMMSYALENHIEVDFIASHGHTIAHVPPKPGSTECGTFQIGESSVIAERTHTLVVSDFRPRDMAVGGQGAPLVPIADWLLFHRPDRVVGCLNIGGIANITVVSPELDDVFAFDTGPGNMIIDGAIRLLSHGELAMDQDGAAAAKGEVIPELLEYLLAHPYYERTPPKSTGREDFGTETFLRDAIAARRKKHPMEDFMATVTAAVARTILDACERFVFPKHTLARLIVSGGGAYNKTLLRLLQEGLPSTAVRTSDDYGMRSDAREALAFAILGNEAICGTPSNVPSATGASRPVILGKFTPP